MKNAAAIKRPASHKWAIFVYVSFIAVNAMLALRGYSDLFTLFLALLCVVQLFGAFFSPRARRHYTLGVVVLWLIALRGLYYALLEPAYEFLTHRADAGAALQLSFNSWGMALCLWLAIAYTFGKPSRAYYGLGP